VKDPSHPSLFYHLFVPEEPLDTQTRQLLGRIYQNNARVDQPAVFALSFLETRPPSLNSRTVLGWLPASSEQAAAEDSSDNGLNDFVENNKFPALLQEAIKDGLLEDEIWTNSAIQAHSGWMHIFDQRNPPPLGRVPEPDDILASVRVEDGAMLIDTYQPMPSYRLCTRDGVCELSEGLMARLRLVLSRVAEEEKNRS